MAIILIAMILKADFFDVPGSGVDVVPDPDFDLADPEDDDDGPEEEEDEDDRVEPEDEEPEDDRDDDDRFEEALAIAGLVWDTRFPSIS